MLFLNIINFHKTMIIAKIFWSKEKWWNSYSWVVHLVGGRGAGVVELAWKNTFLDRFSSIFNERWFWKTCLQRFTFLILMEVDLSFELCQFKELRMSPSLPLPFLTLQRRLCCENFQTHFKSWNLFSLSLMPISQMMMIIMIMIIVMIIN